MFSGSVAVRHSYLGSLFPAGGAGNCYPQYRSTTLGFNNLMRHNAKTEGCNGLRGLLPQTVKSALLVVLPSPPDTNPAPANRGDSPAPPISDRLAGQPPRGGRQDPAAPKHRISALVWSRPVPLAFERLQSPFSCGAFSFSPMSSQRR